MSFGPPYLNLLGYDEPPDPASAPFSDTACPLRSLHLLSARNPARSDGGVGGFDPSIVPATGTPEPGGLSLRQVADLLLRVLASRRCVGADVVELSPIPGFVGPDVLVARLVYRVAGLIAMERGWLP